MKVTIFDKPTAEEKKQGITTGEKTLHRSLWFFLACFIVGTGIYMVLDYIGWYN